MNGRSREEVFEEWCTRQGWSITSLDDVMQVNPTVNQVIRSGGNAEECVVILHHELERVKDKLRELLSQQPMLIVVSQDDGSTRGG